jgi:hypothetical protein
MYTWYAKGTKGNALSLIMEFYGLSFNEAVQELTGQNITLASPSPSRAEPKHTEIIINKADNIKRVLAYLTKTRHIDYERILKPCLAKHLISQDTSGNAVFKWFYKDTLTGAELQGTCSDVRYKGVLAGSKSGYGFTVTTSPNPSKILFFESSIDLLSYWQLFYNKLNSHILVSMAGLKEATVIETTQRLGLDLANAYLCVDNDEAGRQFAHQLKARLGVKVHLPKEHKDWNEVLKRAG